MNGVSLYFGKKITRFKKDVRLSLLSV